MANKVPRVIHHPIAMREVGHFGHTMWICGEMLKTIQKVKINSGTKAGINRKIFLGAKE